VAVKGLFLKEREGHPPLAPPAGNSRPGGGIC
jgi:hypothetical protein